MKPLVWTKKKPTKPGWYFYRKRDKSVAFGYVESDGEFNQGSFISSYVSSLRGLWAGPIPEPQEPKKIGKCPWCKRRGKVEITLYCAYPYSVSCPNTHCQTQPSTNFYKTPEQAIAAWNKGALK